MLRVQILMSVSESWGMLVICSEFGSLSIIVCSSSSSLVRLGWGTDCALGVVRWCLMVEGGLKYCVLCLVEVVGVLGGLRLLLLVL